MTRQIAFESLPASVLLTIKPLGGNELWCTVEALASRMTGLGLMMVVYANQLITCRRFRHPPISKHACFRGCRKRRCGETAGRGALFRSI